MVAWLVLAATVTVGLTVGGFFVTRQNRAPFWYAFIYAFICGVVPGFLLLRGWGAIHVGLAKGKTKELQITGLRGTVILTIIVGLFLVIGLVNVLRN
jgi:uncharacterized membrane protein YhaH (DUF805 family)